jgi:hypothetical protein
MMNSHHKRAINLKRLSESGTNSGPLIGVAASYLEPRSGKHAKHEECLADESGPKIHPAGLDIPSKAVHATKDLETSCSDSNANPLTHQSNVGPISGPVEPSLERLMAIWDVIDDEQKGVLVRYAETIIATNDSAIETLS